LIWGRLNSHEGDKQIIARAWRAKMNTNSPFIILVVAAATSFALTDIAIAKDHGPDPMPSFELLDADKDGLVTKVELTAYRDAEMKAADINADGNLSVEELAAAQLAKMTARAQLHATKIIEDLDADSDGLLSVTEFAARPNADKMFDRIDEDQDGMVSKAEADAAIEKMKEHEGRGGKHGKHGKHGGGWFGGGN
jgi:Ca2+-binding EF-hand superfamily protein